MENYSHCPACNSSWHYKEIPEEYRENYSPPYYYSRVISYQTWESDCTLYYVCPDCGARFDPMGQRMNDK